MSMQAWEESGYGILNDGYLGVSFVKYIKDNQKYISGDAIHNLIGQDFSKDDFLSELELCQLDEDNELASEEEMDDNLADFLDCNPLYILADILNSKFGTTGFEGKTYDEESNTGLVYVPLYPWQVKENDRLVTQDKLDQIFSDLEKALGWNGKPDYQTFYYCG